MLVSGTLELVTNITALVGCPSVVAAALFLFSRINSPHVIYPAAGYLVTAFKKPANWWLSF